MQLTLQNKKQKYINKDINKFRLQLSTECKIIYFFINNCQKHQK